MAEAKVEHPWPRTAPSHILQQTLRDLDRACRTHGTFGVRWRAKQRWQPSFRFPDPRHLSIERLGRKRGRARLPKLGWVIFRWSRPLGGRLKSATVSRDGKHWYVSFLVETGTAGPAVSLERGRVGIDRGVAALAATSDGRFFDRSFITPGEAERYRRLQQQHARTPEGIEPPKSVSREDAGHRAKGPRPPPGLPRADGPPRRRRQWPRRSRGPQHSRRDRYRKRDLSRAGNACRAEGRTESRDPRQGLALLRTGSPQPCPSYRHRATHCQPGFQFNNLPCLWICASGQPREPSEVRLHLLRSPRARRHGRREERTGPRAYGSQGVETSAPAGL